MSLISNLYTGETIMLAADIERCGVEITPESATITIVNGSTTVVDGAAAGISGNRIYYIWSPTTSGQYTGWWEIVYSDETKKFKHTLNVEASG